MDFNRYDDPIQASINDLNAYFDERLLKRAVNEKTKKSKISMAAGCSILEGFQDGNVDDIFIPATHGEQPKGASKEIISKVWKIS